MGKKTSPKPSRSDVRKRKYALIVNVYGSRDLARKAEDWSYSRIEKELGIKAQQKSYIPSIKPLSKAQRKEKQKTLDYFRGYVEKGLTVQEAFAYRKIAPERKRSLTKKEKERIVILPPPDPTVEGWDGVVMYGGRPIVSKKMKWGIWSRYRRDDPISDTNIPFPKQIEEFAIKMNLKAGYDAHAHYGFAYAWYMFVGEYSFTEAASRLKVNPDSIKGYEYKGDLIAL